MAVTNELRDFDASITFDLLAAMRRHSWSTRASRDGELVEEVMPLYSFGDAGAVSADTGDLEALARLARLYKFDRIRDNGVWWRWFGNNETAKRALVDSMWLEYPATEAVSPHALTEAVIAELHMRRNPYFEGEALGVNVSGAVGNFGSKLTIPAAGVEDGRISQLVVTNSPLNIASYVDSFVVGIRPAYNGFTNFDPNWPLAPNMTAGTDTSVNQTPANGAISGARTVVTFSTTPGWASRGYALLGDVVAYNHMADYAGRYRMYLRCRVPSGSSQVFLQARTGFRFGTNQVYGPIREITSSGWATYDVGAITIPPAGGRGVLDLTSGTNHAYDLIMVEFYAERLSGSSNLEIDSLCLVPDYSMLHATGIAADQQSDTFRYIVHPDGSSTHYRRDSAQIYIDTSMDVHAANWVTPAEGGVLVWLQSGDGQDHDENGDAEIQIQAYPRYPSLNKD